jgi:hypothetical protein
VALLLGAPPPAAEFLRTLAPRLPCGLTAEASPLACLADGRSASARGSIIGRTAIQTLCREGWNTPQSLADASPDPLARALGDEDLAGEAIRSAREAIRRAARRPAAPASIREKFRLSDAGSPVGAPTRDLETRNLELESPCLALDLQSPGIVQIAGRDLSLSPLLYDLLAALAQQPGRVLTRQALYHRLWPEGGPEAQQLDAHRRRLVAALRPALGRAADSLVQVVRGVGFRLNVRQERVQLRRG